MQNLPKNLRTRIAPTPSGFLHIGNAFSFILTWLIARKTKGHLHLRIDDSDSTRTRLEYLEDIFENLNWLGLDYDSGAKNLTDFQQNYSQKDQFLFYQKFLNELIKKNQIYACNCSRSKIKKSSLSGKYLGFCQNRNLDFNSENVAWRIRIPTQKWISVSELFEIGNPTKKVLLSEITDDFVVRRKDKIPAYQIISLAEDMKENINFVVRGKDLEDSTIRQLFLAETLNLPHFQKALFWHHPLILDQKNEKLAKSKGAVSLQQMQKKGQNSSEIYQLVAKYLGISVSENVTLSELLEKFNLSESEAHFMEKFHLIK